MGNNIILVHPIIGQKTFVKEHAENIMNLTEAERGGWEYFKDEIEPTDSKDSKQKKHGSISSRNKGDSSK